MRKAFSSLGMIIGTILTFFVGSTLGSAIYGGILGAKLAVSEPGLASDSLAISERIQSIVMENLAVVTAIGGIGIFLLAVAGLKIRREKIGVRLQMGQVPILDIGKAILVGAVMQGFFVALEMLTQISRLDTGAVEQMGSMMLQGNFLITILIVAVWVPFYEEFLFRGILYTGLRKQMAPWLSILICGVVFGMIHMNLWQLVTISVMGWMMAYSYERTASFWVPYGMHVGLNLAGVLLVRSSIGLDYPKLVFVGILAGTLLLSAWILRSLKAGRWEADLEIQMDI